MLGVFHVIGRTGMCVLSNGKLCVSNPSVNTVLVVTQDGRLEGHLKTGLPPLKEPFSPAELASNKQGEVFVCDSPNHVVRVFDQNGNECRRFGDQNGKPGRLHTPCGVAMTPDGNVAVTDIENHNVQVQCCFDFSSFRGGWFYYSFSSHLKLLL